MIPHGVEVFVGLDPIDLRWGFERLSGVVAEKLGRSSRSGRCSCFSASVGQRSNPILRRRRFSTSDLIGGHSGSSARTSGSYEPGGRRPRARRDCRQGRAIAPWPSSPTSPARCRSPPRPSQPVFSRVAELHRSPAHRCRTRRTMPRQRLGRRVGRGRIGQEGRRGDVGHRSSARAARLHHHEAVASKCR
jgi:hypothetical protein